MDLVESCHGDIRKCVNTLQFLLSSPTIKLTQPRRVGDGVTTVAAADAAVVASTREFAHDDAVRNEHHYADCFRSSLQQAVSSSEDTASKVNADLKALKGVTTDLSLVDTLIGRKRNFTVDSPAASTAILTAGVVSRRPFALRHTDLQNVLEEDAEGRRLEYPSQTNVKQFSTDFSDYVAAGVVGRFHRQFRGGVAASNSTTPLPTHLRPTLDAAMALTHVDNSRRLRTLKARLPLETDLEKNVFCLDYMPFLKNVVFSEERRAKECPKRRFMHYLKTIDFPNLDDVWTDGKNDKYIKARFGGK